jgi:hypothetical protein
VAGEALVLPGRLALVADHVVLALRDGGTTDPPSFVLSWYAVAYAADGPAGNLAFVRSDRLTAGEAVLTDTPDLDRALRSRLRPASWPLAEPDRTAERATFERTGIRDGRLDARISAGPVVVTASWRRLGEPIVAAGRVGADPPWDSSTVLVEAAEWEVRVNGRVEPGEPFANDVWLRWFGRPLSSALVAMAEVFREATT